MGVLMECHAMCCSVSRLHEWGLVDEALQYVIACCSMLQHVAVCCSMLQCVEASCFGLVDGVVECVAVFQRKHDGGLSISVAMYYSVSRNHDGSLSMKCCSVS